MGARDFVVRWRAAVLETDGRVAGNETARTLVRHREIKLKGARSRFTNARVLEERWKGYAGIGVLNYRWPQVQRLMSDLYGGLAKR
jgi:hypothetical protein